MHAVLAKIGQLGLIPVVRIGNAKHTVPLGKALLAGHLPIVQIGINEAPAEDAIAAMSGELPDLLIGAGDVVTTVQVEKATAAGARFIVSPAFDPEIVAFCAAKGIAIIPGMAGLADIEMAIERNVDVLYYSPAESLGGLPNLKLASAPYRDIRFVPCGGIDMSNFISYLLYEKVHACGVSWMVNPELIEAESFGEISRLAREAVFSMLGFEFSHLGINDEDRHQACRHAEEMGALFNLPVAEGERSVMASRSIEILKTPYLGSRGHLGIGTNDIRRAMAFLERQGVCLRKGTEQLSDGKLKVIYLDMDIAGFAVHLVQK
jgi:2-dehydro-3-deoxyphosphogluconate aldolase/(4S)-4-hydroxy-2-oxoglutarate aldolase